MNRISDKEINERVLGKYRMLTQLYSEDRILGVFVVGLANYGFAEESSELKFVSIYMPTFEDICTAAPIYTTIDDTKIIDLRVMYSISEKHEKNGLELLYCKYKKLNPRYERIFVEALESKREQFAHYWEYERILKARDRAAIAINDCDFFEAARLQIASELYANGASGEECFRPTKDYLVTYLWNVKENCIDFSIDDTMDAFEPILKQLKKKPPKEKVLKKLKMGILDLMQYALKKRVDTDLFFNSLTPKEQIAFEAISEAIDGHEEGWITTSTLVQETGVSVSVFRTLLQKMNEKGVAEVSSHGAKGTKIIMLN